MIVSKTYYPSNKVAENRCAFDLVRPESSSLFEDILEGNIDSGVAEDLGKGSFKFDIETGFSGSLLTFDSSSDFSVWGGFSVSGSNAPAFWKTNFRFLFPSLNGDYQEFYVTFIGENDTVRAISLSVYVETIDPVFTGGDTVSCLDSVTGSPYREEIIELDSGYESCFRLVRVGSYLYLVLKKDGRWTCLPFDNYGEMPISIAVGADSPDGAVDIYHWSEDYLVNLKSGITLTMVSEPILYIDTPQRYGLPFAHIDSFNKDTITASLEDVPPGDHLITLAGETFDLLVIPATDSNDVPTFMQSNVGLIDLEGGEIYLCQNEGERGDLTSGNMVVIPDCCFQDGSDRDLDEFQVIGNSVGSLNQLKDRFRSPKILMKDGDTLLGCNFDFQRLFEGASFEDFSTSQQVILSRQLSLGDSKRLFYGYMKDFTWPTDSTRVLDIEIEYTDVYISAALLGKVEVNVFDETGLAIVAPVMLDKDNLTATISVGVTFRRIVVEARMYIDVNAGADLYPPIAGTSVRISVFDTEDYDLLETVFTEIQETVFPDIEIQGAYVRAYVELMPNLADMFAIVWNPLTEGEGEVSNFVTFNPVLNARTRTRSVAAIQKTNGDIVFIYRENRLGSEWDDAMSSKLLFSVYDEAGVFKFQGEVFFDIEFTIDHSIHAFDVVSNGEDVLFFVSWRQIGNKILRPNSDSPKMTTPYQPMSQQGVTVFSAPLGSAFSDNLQLVSKLEQTVNGEIVSTIFRDIAADHVVRQVSSTIGWRGIKFPQAGFIRANHDNDNGLIVLTTVDQSTRLPVVYTGTKQKLVTVAVPVFFDLYEKLMSRFEAELRSAAIFFGRIDTASFTYGHDGVLYGIASKNQSIEMATVDQSRFWNQSEAVYEPYSFFVGEFLDSNVALSSLDEVPDVFGPVTVDLTRHQQYLSYCLGVQTEVVTTPSSKPIVFQNAHYDEMPMEAPSDVFWSYDLNPDYLACFYQENMVYDTYRSHITNQATSKMGLQLTNDTVQALKHVRVNEGYRFKARVQTSGTYTTPFVITALACTTNTQSVDDFDILSVDPDGSFVFFACGVKISEDYIQPFIYNNLFVDNTDITLLDQIPIAVGEIYDISILVRRSDKLRATGTFVVKQCRHLMNESYEFRNDLVGHSTSSAIRGTIQTIPAISGMEIEGNPDTAYASEVLYVYSMEWGLLKKDMGHYRLVDSLLKDEFNEPIYQVPITSKDRPEGRWWRNYNDQRLLTYSTQGGARPQYSFIVGYSQDNGYSPGFHWYNGFIITFAGSTVFPEDEWTVRRLLANSPVSSHSDELHGLWVSETDGIQDGVKISIYGNRLDQSLGVTGELRCDTVVLTGVNFEKVRLTSDLGEPMAVADSIKFRVNITEVVSDLPYLTLVSDKYMDHGKFSNENIYIRLGSGRPMKVVEIFGDNIKVRPSSDDQVVLPGEAIVFGGNIIMRFNGIIDMPLVNLIIPEQITFEGYYRIHCVDAGKLLEISSDAPGESYFRETAKTVKLNVSGNQAVNVRSVDSNERAVELTYTTRDIAAWMELTSLVERIGVSRKPVWMFRDRFYKRLSANLCLLGGSPTYRPIIDSSGDKSYELQLTLVPVE